MFDDFDDALYQTDMAVAYIKKSQAILFSAENIQWHFQCGFNMSRDLFTY